ncbi:MAG: hypothetical protein HY097_00640 [Nitrospinae bacterium]|nr:hypothetical protein [Nitrospinota bacterium]MBI3815148.1 hypothetical protein [Nitrospinota bacterium]
MSLIKIPKKHLVSMDKETLILDLPDSITDIHKKINYDKVLQAKGTLKNKKEDILKYIRDIRGEWE